MVLENTAINMAKTKTSGYLVAYALKFCVVYPYINKAETNSGLSTVKKVKNTSTEE